MAITKTLFGNLPTGEDVYCYRLTNGDGLCAEILSYGGILKNLYVKDKTGKTTDVVLGRGTMDEYLTNSGYLGALIGRHANRIAGGKFTIDGAKYSVGVNEGENSLHGGHTGFDKKIWICTERDGAEPSLTLTYFSEDGEEGFPADLTVTVTYTLTSDNALKIHYLAAANSDTVVNMTNHAYFNLAGHDSGAVDDQLLTVNSDFYTPNGADCMPTGEILSVKGTPFDFRSAKRIGDGINSDHEQIRMFGGYDHNFVLNGSGYRLAASAYCENSGIAMDVYTDKPGVQLYTSNGLGEGEYTDGAHYGVHQAFCLETQYFPNSMSFSHFPSPVLRRGEVYDFTTEYRFSVK